MHEIQLLFARKGDGGFNPTRVRASKGDAGFRRAGRLVYRTQMRYPWPAAGPGRAASGRPTLQTSSNQHDLNRLARTSVTNVVNLSPKTSIFSEKADGLTTFVTTGQKSTRKTPWIDDVCNNTRQARRQHTRHHLCGGRRRDLPRCPWAAAGPGRASRRHTSTRQHTRSHWCGGRRRGLPRCRWAAAGPGRASRRRAERSSRRGRLAGGPPPTGTQSSPAHRTARAAPGTPVVPQSTPKKSELLVVLRVLVGLAAVGAAERADRRHLLVRQ